MRPVERIGLGCVALTSLPSAGAARNLLDTAFEAGVRHFDTAPSYGRGYSEKLLAPFLKGRRDQVSVATKFSAWGHPRPRLPAGLALPLNGLKRRLRPPPAVGASSAPPPPRSAVSGPYITRAEIEGQFDASRRSLQVDYVDLYLLHEEVPTALMPDAWAYLNELKAKGLVRRLGLAAHGGYYRALGPADVTGWDVLQYEFGQAWPANAAINSAFPAQSHIVHSVLKDVPRNAEAIAGALREALAQDPGGMVLFSSTNPEHLRANLRALAA